MAMLPVVGGGPATTILEALVAWGAEAKDFEKWQALTESLFIGVGSQPSLIEKLLLADLQQGDTQKNDGNMMPPAKDAEGRLLAQLILLVGGQGALALWGELSAGQLQGLFAEYNTLLNPVQSQRDWAEQMFRAAPQGVLATFDDDIHRWMAD
ncbi:hypothetical protein [Candidatus Cyanaurora vandensis]|uniref:hypothetical protein n=1 Tax=Candidatus Cyanaurora vandensis TaxID=2714958 RepID=UPI00257F51F3|nr:hypothetical protein [Candidatus Cyanaurora vandensis]